MIGNRCEKHIIRKGAMALDHKKISEELGSECVGEIESIAEVITSIAKRERDELLATQAEDLERFWTFRYNLGMSADWNLYQFSESLDIYRRRMRQWEQHHNGYCCVVERVRDKYLMPKIKEFRLQLEVALLAKK